jgi:sugar lactone lactonase YvrE
VATVLHSLTREDEFVLDVINEGAPVEPLMSGLGFLEGPTSSGAPSTLLFTDIPADRIVPWTRAGGGFSWIAHPHFAIGLAQDSSGRVLAGEQSTARTRSEADGPLGADRARHGFVRELDGAGTLSALRLFGELPAGVPAGIRVAVAGRLYPSGLGRVYVYAPSDSPLGRVAAPRTGPFSF